MTVLDSTQQIVLMKEGAAASIGEFLGHLRPRSVFLVADREAHTASGACDAIGPWLADRSTVCFDEFEPNPKFEDVERGLRHFGKATHDLVLAVGGGSALDMAKLISVLAVQTSAPRDIIEGRAEIESERPPLVAVPTTAGTGSEATHFAVVFVEGRKYSLAHRSVLPDYAIVDPRLTHDLPAPITAASGLDAFSQALESIWSIHSSAASVSLASEALDLVWRNLAAAVRDPNPSAREAMCRAAHLAGKAINLTKTTAPHAMSYAITTDFGVPHGLAVALTLPVVFGFNLGVTASDCADPRGPEHVRASLDRIALLLGFQDAEEAPSRIEELIASLNCPTRLSEVGIGEDGLRDLTRQVNPERLANNPRRLTGAAIESLLRAAL